MWHRQNHESISRWSSESLFSSLHCGMPHPSSASWEWHAAIPDYLSSVANGSPPMGISTAPRHEGSSWSPVRWPEASLELRPMGTVGSLIHWFLVLISHEVTWLNGLMVPQYLQMMQHPFCWYSMSSHPSCCFQHLWKTNQYCVWGSYLHHLLVS